VLAGRSPKADLRPRAPCPPPHPTPPPPTPSYVILPKDFEAGYKQVIRKGDTEFAFYQ
jgi:hypothetical protein